MLSLRIFDRDFRPRPLPQGDITGLQFSTSAADGHRAAAWNFRGSVADAVGWYNFLSAPVEIHWGSTLVWAGFLYSISFENLGISYSLSQIATAVKAIYIENREPRETPWAENAPGIAAWGRWEAVVNAGEVSAAVAAERANLTLYFRAHSLNTAEFAPAAREVEEEVARCSAVGWKAALGAILHASTDESLEDTGAQIRARLADFNAAFSPHLTYSSATVPDSGIAVPRKQTSYCSIRERVDALAKFGLKIGSTTYGAWLQVWDRTVYLARWARGNFPNPDYFLWRGTIFDAGGNPVPPACVVADRVLMSDYHQPAARYIGDPLDSPRGYYILETSFSEDGGLRLRPAGWKDFLSIVLGGE